MNLNNIIRPPSPKIPSAPSQKPTKTTPHRKQEKDVMEKYNKLIQNIEIISRKAEGLRSTQENLLVISRTLIENVLGLLSPVPGTGTTITWLTGKAIDAVGASSFNRDIHNRNYTFESASTQLRHMCVQMINDLTRFTDKENYDTANFESVRNFKNNTLESFQVYLKGLPDSSISKDQKDNLIQGLIQNLDEFEEKFTSKVQSKRTEKRPLLPQTDKYSDGTNISESRGEQVTQLFWERKDGPPSPISVTDQEDSEQFNPLHSKDTPPPIKKTKSVQESNSKLKSPDK
ncbi:MAG: hypothetical protein VW397_07020 [Candidatus Margulisiibacteriota bacterium]